ncbi:MAG: uracil phosphoribosyltransferase [Actinomycetaceae bacterium]|nr:uracil phosphoribosyltransferase [Actinomycetaceae bacterium]
MRFTVIDHPLVEHKLTVLRDRDTPSQTFRLLVDELVTLLAYEATRHIQVEAQAINTPVAPTIGKKLTQPRPIVIPILRAGLGMLEGMMRLLPTAEVGFLGMKRDEDTLMIETYANRLPDDLTDRQVFLVDPMLATGGTLVAAINYVLERGARDVTCVCLVSSPQGVKTVEEAVGDRADVQVVTAALDEGLNEHAYIVPGLGDAGDRLYGIVDY